MIKMSSLYKDLLKKNFLKSFREIQFSHNLYHLYTIYLA
jgi:hypothetical protein